MKESYFYKNIVRVSLFSCMAVVLAANSFAAIVLKNVQVDGNKRIEASTIVSNSDLKVGQSVEQNDLDQAVRKLFDSGYFADVKVDMQGQTALIRVEENPIVNRIYFENNKQFDDATLTKQIKLQPRQIYTISKLKQDTKTIHDMMRVKGYFGAKVTPKIVKQDQNRVDVIFEFVEGGSTKVAQLIFVGNKHFSSDALKRVVNTRESKWWRFFSTDDNYDADRLALDGELLRRHYLENGYVDFQLKSSVAELTPDHKEFFITYTIEEGARYSYGKVDIDVQVPKIDTKALKKELLVQSGDWYNTKDMDKSIKAMTEYLGSHGYAFVDIKPRLDPNLENRTIDLTFEVMEGPKTYINRIIIVGNVRTNEEVIRRELLVYEGDAYNTYNIKRSKDRVTNLGFFKDVKITERPAEASDKVDLMIELEEEESTGELWVAGGFSTAEGLLANVGIKENNLMGRGQVAHIQATASKKRQQIDFGFMEPHFLNRNIAAGFDVFKVDSKMYSNGSYQSQRTGLNLKLGYELTEYLGQAWTYTVQYEKIGQISSNASAAVRSQSRDAITSALIHKLNYDRRDSRFEPTTGYYVGMTNEVAGLGGDTKYLRNEINGAYYHSVAENWILSFSGSTGIMNGYGGKEVRIQDRFTMGGDGSLRGFRESGAEPRERQVGVKPSSCQPLGGLKYYLGTIELQVPLEPFGVPNELGIKSHLFSDIGAAWDASGLKYRDGRKIPVYDSSDPRISVGFGVSWRSPLGPLRIDFADHQKTKFFDKHKTIHFGFFTGK